MAPRSAGMLGRACGVRRWQVESSKFDANQWLWWRAFAVVVLIVGGFTAIVIGAIFSLPWPQAVAACGLVAFVAGLVCMYKESD